VTETHLDMTYGDVVAKVAQRRGLQKGDGGSSTVVHEAVVQWNETDWEFLSGLAAEIGHEIICADGRLHLRQPNESSNAPGGGNLDSDDARQLVAGANLLHLRATVSGAEQVEEVHVRSWDYKTKEAVEGTAKAGDGARSATAGEGGAGLASKLKGGTMVHADLAMASEEVARHYAEALVEQLGSAAVELDGVVFGNPALRAGVSVSVANVGAPFDGKYVLTSCRHTYDPDGGYLTAFRVSGRQKRTILGLMNGKRAGGDRSGLAGVVPAVVSNVDDPDRLGRVKLSFPWLAEKAESFWARVALPGAGPERGLAVLPEVGDEVLVAFAHGDTRLPYVLGGLYNGKDKLPGNPVDGNEIVSRALVSRKAHKLELHDKDEAITIVTGDEKHRIVLDQKGSKIIVETSGDVEVTAKGNVSVKATSDLKLEASGKIEIKGNGVTIDAGGAAFSAKGSTAKVEGSGTAELSSSGQTTVRGSMVMIN
jgi:uncharacterized protein involved in type VI secretion and phage assembly